MNCKNCGAPVEADQTKCLVCNNELENNGELLIRDQKPEINKGLEPVASERTVPIDIKPIEMFKEEPVTIPVVVEPVAEIIGEVVEENPQTKRLLLPEDRGGNIFFLVIGILLLLGAGGFFVYAKFVNPEIINEVMYYFNPNLKPTKDILPPPVFRIEDFEKYNEEEITYDELKKLFDSIDENVKLIGEDIEIYKKVLPEIKILEDADKQLNILLSKYTNESLFKMRIIEKGSLIYINYININPIMTATQ